MNRFAHSYVWPAALLFTLIAFGACGGADDGGGAPGSTTPTTSNTGGGGGNTNTGGATTTSGTGGGTTSTGGGSTSTGGSGGGGSCDSWLVTYDLTGSVFFIDALFDFTITCETPYDADDTMGPGTMVLRFADDNGAPAPGSASIVEYSMDQLFVTGITGIMITTDLETAAGPEVCGVAAGALSGSTLTWNPTQMDPFCQDGQVSCVGALCGTSGSPPQNQPLVFDNDCSKPHPLADFTFTNGVASFTMPAVTISQSSSQTTTMAFAGTQTDIVLDTATPGCACN